MDPTDCWAIIMYMLINIFLQGQADCSTNYQYAGALFTDYHFYFYRHCTEFQKHNYRQITKTCLWKICFISAKMTIREIQVCSNHFCKFLCLVVLFWGVSRGGVGDGGAGLLFQKNGWLIKKKTKKRQVENINFDVVLFNVFYSYLCFVLTFTQTGKHGNAKNKKHYNDPSSNQRGGVRDGIYCDCSSDRISVGTHAGIIEILKKVYFCHVKIYFLYAFLNCLFFCLFSNICFCFSLI